MHYLLKANVKIKRRYTAINLFDPLIKCLILCNKCIYKLGSQTQFTCSFMCMRVCIFLIFRFFCYLWLASCKLRNKKKKSAACEPQKKTNKNYVDEALNKATKKEKRPTKNHLNDPIQWSIAKRK